MRQELTKLEAGFHGLYVLPWYNCVVERRECASLPFRVNLREGKLCVSVRVLHNYAADFRVPTSNMKPHSER